MSPSIEDIDYSTDQSTRITRRVAHGVYRLIHGAGEVGAELWGIFALRNGGFRLMTEIDLHWPVPNQQRTRLDVDTAWNPQALWAQVDFGSTRRIATYRPASGGVDIDVVETRMRPDEETDRRKARDLVSRVATVSALPRASPGKTVLRRRMPFSPTTHLDFGSALFSFVVLQRFQLQPGARITFDSIILTLPGLEPLQIRQTYSYLRDETVVINSAQSMTRCYRISELNAQGAESAATTFWTDGHGIVTRQELMLDDALHSCEMTNYHWSG